MSEELSDREYDVLNAVVLKKVASAGQVADATDRDAQDVSAVFDRLQQAGALAVLDGQALPTEAAEPRLQTYAARHYATVRERNDVEEAYERFERLNRRFLDAMHQWQQVEVGGQMVANDHSDPEYDAKVIDTINGLVERLGRVIDALADDAPRFERYRRRFEAAMDRVDRDETEYVSSPQHDSVHNIWFELHEDLLRTLGKERRE